MKSPTCDEQKLLPNCIGFKASVKCLWEDQEGEKTGPDMYHALNV